MTDTLLGRDITTNKDITLTPKEFALGGYIVGVRRMGKSLLMENMAVQSIEQGIGVCLIDPHGDTLYTVLSRIPQQRMRDVILLDPLYKDGAWPFGLNVYHCENKHSPRAVEYTVNRVLSLFKKLWPSETAQPLVEDVVLNTALTIIANDLTMVEVPKLLFDDAFRKRMVANVTNADVLDFWRLYENPRSLEREQGGGTVGRRVRRFTASGIIRYIVGQSEKILPVRQILDTQKIVLVRLYSDMKELTTLVGSILIGQFLQAALSRSGADQRPEFHLYCDEYSNFATDDFSEIISECGKYNLIPFIAHQSTGQISEQNQDSAIQLGNLFCFKVIGKDSENLAGNLDYTPLEADKREKTIPSDVLMHLSDHSNKHVKEFERNVVRKLLQAKALRTQERDYKTHPDGGGMRIFEITRTETIYPKYIFDDMQIIFDPNDLLKLLEVMETFLFDTM